jgi:hypothetical protein
LATAVVTIINIVNETVNQFRIVVLLVILVRVQSLLFVKNTRLTFDKQSDKRMIA